ncbi:YwqG family protein [Chryseobacterium aahli]|uniref:YwqG family protein n=1 Tax=Chryseobacterium aahli TaxID=1278643 RepID=UPI0021D414BF|nr:YwqG family protein [Chryseobacterium aahli]
MIPEFLNEFKAQLEKYKLETIKIVATPLKNEESLPIHSSKFLGRPYLPIGMEYPKDKENKPMVLWAQINFSDIPILEGYPKHGILQFFYLQNGLIWMITRLSSMKILLKNFKQTFHF